MPAILLDIEGTTTPISFVYDVLFPYAREHLARYLGEHGQDPSVSQCMAAFAEQARLDGSAPGDVVQQALAMAADRKVTCLKTLQGLIGKEGYERGLLRGEVYPDVPPALRDWRQRGVPVYIYSSGSIAAQQLLFRYSTCGDLTPYLTDYFDTTSGPKRLADSYRTIVASIDQPVSAVTFATDILEEAQAASAAGLRPVLLTRPGNAPLSPHPFTEAPDLLSL